MCVRNKIRIRLFVLYDEYIRITTNLYRYYYEVRTLKELKLIIDLSLFILGIVLKMDFSIISLNGGKTVNYNICNLLV